MYADLAQLAEHLSCKQRVGGSNPLVGTYICGSSSVVEQHLAMVGVAGSIPVFRFVYYIMPGWRNWQTPGHQNLAVSDHRTAALPVSGACDVPVS